MGNILSKDGLIDEIKRWYDGFKFSESGENVYNPVSIGQFMDNHYRFDNYWFSTGTPSFLIPFLKKDRIIQMFYQTGYLTIDHLKRGRAGRTYKLRFPNYEVEQSFIGYLLSVYVDPGRTDKYTDKLLDAAEEGNQETTST